MEVKINKEIRDYTESVFFGLTLRQCTFAVLACTAAVGLYFLLSPYLALEALSWICILGAAPFAMFGFVKWHSMYAEQIVWALIKAHVLTPRNLVYTPENLYFEAYANRKKDRRVFATKSKEAQTNKEESLDA